MNISGFVVFMDASKARLWGGIKHEQPGFFIHYMPRVYLKDPFGNEINVGARNASISRLLDVVARTAQWEVSATYGMVWDYA
jgi:hypothetical protein